MPTINKWKFWCLISFFIKGILILFVHFFVHVFISNSEIVGVVEGFWGAYGGDTYSYIKPIENLVNNGNYIPDYRMPGYGIFYLPLYYFFSKATALNILIIFHVLLASISTYLLALIAQIIFKDKIYFYLTFFFFVISTNTSIWDYYILTESLTTSFLILTTYLLLRFFENQKLYFLLLSGLCLTEVIFLRPVFMPLLFLFVIILVKISLDSKEVGKRLLVFLIPFILVDGIWTIRNYYTHNKIAPLTTSIYYPELEESVSFPLHDFLKSWGGRIMSWEVGAEIRWFGKAVDKSATIPKEIFTSAFNIDSLKIIREKLIMYNTSISQEKDKKYIEDKLHLYTKSIKSEKPFLYYVKAPFILTKKMLFYRPTYSFSKPISELNKIEYLKRLIKIFNNLFYFLTLVTGLLGILLLLKESLMINRVSLITGIIGYTIIIHGMILRLSEARYLVPVWSFLVICSVYFIVWSYKKIIPKKQLYKWTRKYQ